MHPLSALPSAWRDEAEMVAPYNAGAAVAFQRCADALEQALAESQLEPLTLEAAAAESGYSRDHLRRLLAEGTIPDTGGGRILRRDLPRKPGHGVAPPPREVRSSRLQVAHAVAAERR